ncbi:hypothetical protein ACFXOM_14675 [Streptomyces sp. NPDC059169]|uniref:hypothetical protein n=1 Tax=Streptomyces sp. NPDC059169 TaxID=3346754 RepID=UPI0036BE45B8
MSDKKPQKELTPEQHQAEVAKQQGDQATQLKNQFEATNAYEQIAASGNPWIPLPGGIFGKTSFEQAQLNAMLDLMEHANPSDLSSAGDALKKATTALNEAAKELEDYVRVVEWKGDSGTEFRRYGKELVTYAYGLGTFANAIGTQMVEASTGLSSVRSALPPRDGRANPKKVEDFKPSERRDDNPEYAQAVKAEQHRQEAINQMNRLASFYGVSEQTLAAQEPPKLPNSLGAPVPPPSAQYRADDDSTGGSGAVDAPRSSGHPSVADQPESSGGNGAHPRAGVPGVAPQLPDRDTSMEIDSVTAPPAPPTAPSGAPPSPVTGTAVPSTSQVPPLAPALGISARGTGPKAGPAFGPRTAGPNAGQLGRTSSGSGPAASGRSGPAGRPGGAQATASGRQGLVGRPVNPTTASPSTGRTGTPGPAGQNAVGRNGSTGQQATGRVGQGTSNGSRAGRSNGIVGGTPQRSTGGSTSSRIPRGTVIGADGSPQGRASAGKPGQSGVIGSNRGNGAQRSVGKGTASVNGVVGTPRNGSSSGKPVAGNAAGGGSAQRNTRDKDQERARSERPDYLTEDEETWATRRRGAVPPVID